MWGTTSYVACNQNDQALIAWFTSTRDMRWGQDLGWRPSKHPSKVQSERALDMVWRSILSDPGQPTCPWCTSSPWEQEQKTRHQKPCSRWRCPWAACPGARCRSWHSGRGRPPHSWSRKTSHWTRGEQLLATPQQVAIKFSSQNSVILRAA